MNAAKYPRFCYGRPNEPDYLLPASVKRLVYGVLCLWMLLIGAQQAAVVHEVGHLTSVGRVGASVDTHADTHADMADVAETACALCPGFAQVVTPAFSHALPIPRLLQAKAVLSPEPPDASAGAAVPTPRSRGPPSSS
jgi:hypothetical protein